MGMFDYVNVAINCPHCGTPMNTFKSHDRMCNYSVVDAKDVYSFMGVCVHCNTVVDFYREYPPDDLSPRKGLDYIESLGFKMSTIVKGE